MRLPFPHLYEHSMDSTNMRAMDMLSKIKPEHGFMVIADYQTAGKGQFGRKWQSLAGQNLLCSLIMGPLNWPISRLFALHLCSCLALLNLIRDSGIQQVKIKWPNDLYVGDRKIAGILIENILREANIQWSVIGVGLNVHHFPDDTGINATSLSRETGLSYSIEELAIRLRQQMLMQFSTSQDQALQLIEYNENLYGLGKMMPFKDNFEKAFMAIPLAVDQEGLLHLKDFEGKSLVKRHGDVHWR